MQTERLTASRVGNFVLDLIRSGQYLPGDRLPTERVLSVQLGASRNVVRDGLARLEAAGQVRRVLGSGTYVPLEDVTPATPQWSPRLSSPAEIMEARLALEPRLARLAAIQATAQDIDSMASIDRESRVHLGGDGFERLDAALHAALASATHNRLLSHLYSQITAARDQALWGELKKRSGTHVNRSVYVDEHAGILNAVLRRDPDGAEKAAETHLRSVRRHMLGE
jgi:DNA-binding FadR family transcriptional regulator